MSSLSKVASRLIGGGRRGGASPGTTGRPVGGTTGAGAGGSSTDAAIGKGVRGVLRKLRR